MNYSNAFQRETFSFIITPHGMEGQADHIDPIPLGENFPLRYIFANLSFSTNADACCGIIIQDKSVS
jgi:hypothetical protein